MNNDLEFDLHEISQLATALGDAGPEIRKDLSAVVAKGSLNIKNSARRRIRGLAHAPAYPNSITYDTKETPRGPEAEIGPDKQKRQGALGNILEFGTVNNAPHPHMRPAADSEEPRFARAVEDLIVKQLEGR